MRLVLKNLRLAIVGLCLFLAASCISASDAVPITTSVWQEVVVSVSDVDRSARFFTEIAGFEVKYRGQVDATELSEFGLDGEARGEALVLGAPGHTTGWIRLIDFERAGLREPMRPGARAWDTGCYFSVMMRAKDLASIYADAIELGWWTETPITDLAFGESRLKVVIFRGPDGVQIQTYERLTPPLPDAIGDFDRLTRPFNVMQMVRDRDTAYQFFSEILGFATFYKGKPFVAPEPRPTPLGIPLNLTTSARYQAGIVYPVPGEFGRMEMIEMMDLKGHDYSDRCNAPNLGILAVRYPVRDADDAAALIAKRDTKRQPSVVPVTVAPYGDLKLLNVTTPDGALIQFYERN